MYKILKKNLVSSKKRSIDFFKSIKPLPAKTNVMAFGHMDYTLFFAIARLIDPSGSKVTASVMTWGDGER